MGLTTIVPLSGTAVISVIGGTYERFIDSFRRIAYINGLFGSVCPVQEKEEGKSNSDYSHE
jgi:hypothetical protein